MRLAFLAVMTVSALTALFFQAAGTACAMPGLVLWEATYSSRPGEDDDRARGLAIDDKGNIAVAGYVNARQGNYDYLTIKYGPYGSTEWIREFDHSRYDVGRAVTFDGAGNVIVAGASDNLDNPRDSYSGAYYTDYRVVRYGPAGESLSEMTATGNLKNNEPYAVIAGKEGDIYVAGKAKNASDTYPEYYTVKFSPSGELLWSRAEDWGSEACATGIRFDAAGNIMVTGYYKDLETGNYIIRTIRYSPDGEKLDGELVYKSDTFDVKAWGLAVDAEGDVILAGETSEDGGVALALKYSPAGELLWAAKYESSEYRNRGSAVAADADGRIYVAGRTFKEDQTGDWLLVVYDKDGRLIDGKTYPFGGDSSAEAVVLDMYGNIAITGTTIMPGQPGIIRTVRIEGYRPRKESGFPVENILDPGSRLSLTCPAAPMLRHVELAAYRADPGDPNSPVSLVARPVDAPGEYEYRFYQCLGSAHHWERLTDYTDNNSVVINPAEKPVRVMVEVRAKGSGLRYEARKELDL